MFTFYLEFNHIYLLTGECKRQKSTQEYAVLDEFMWLDRFPKIEESFKGRFFGKIACGPAIYHLWKVFAQQQLDELLLYPATCGGPFERLEKKLLYENGAERGLKPWGEDQHWKFPAISGTDGENQNKLNQYLLKCMAQIKRKYDEKKEKDKADYDSELGDGINTNISSNRNHSRKRKLSDDIDDEQSNCNDSKKKRRKLNQSRGKKETNSNNNNSNNRQRSSSPSPFSSAPTIITSEPPKKHSKEKHSPRTPKPKNAKPKKVPKKDAPSSSDLPPNLSPSPPSPRTPKPKNAKPKNANSKNAKPKKDALLPSSSPPSPAKPPGIIAAMKQRGKKVRRRTPNVTQYTKYYGNSEERKSLMFRGDQYDPEKCQYDEQKQESYSIFETTEMKELNRNQRNLKQSMQDTEENNGNKNKNKKKKTNKNKNKNKNKGDISVCYLFHESFVLFFVDHPTFYLIHQHQTYFLYTIHIFICFHHSG